MFEDNENIYPVKPDLLVKSGAKQKLGFFLLMLAFIVFSTDFTTSTYIVLLEIAAVLIVHELGHFLMMRLYNTKSQGMFFMSFLGNRTKNLRFSNSQKQHTVINLMGPIPGIIMGTVLFFIVIYSEPNTYLIEFALLLLGINILNLVPIDPFDGGRVIGGFFFNKNDHQKMIFTLVSSVAIISVGVIFNFIPLIVFGFLMGLKVRSYQKSNYLHEALEESNVNYKKEYGDLTNREYWKIRSVFLTFNPKLKEMIPSGYNLWDNERLLMEQVRQVLRTDIKPDMSNLTRFFVLVLMVLLIALPIVLVLSNIEIVDWYLQNTNV